MEIRTTPQTITAITRRDITDYIVSERINWAGRLEEPAFLQRIWPDLDSMPSTDHRFSTATRDIYQHRVYNPQDWEDDWVFDDPRFGLRSGPDELFVEFLAQMLHPVVRSDRDEVERLRRVLNDFLEPDDWELVEVSQISGRPVFEGRRREALKKPTESLGVDGYERLDDPQVIRDHLRRIDRDLKGDPAGAVASSKELVETVCKTILDDYGVEYSTRDDLPDLYKKVQKVMKLNAEAVPGDKRGSEAAVKALRALVTTIQSLAELRNAIGRGHGRTTRSPAVSRHARLAFNSAVAVTEFLLDTWHVRRTDEDE
jgi:hypothetical protein